MFKTLNSQHLNKLAKRLRERHYNAGEVIIEQGDNGIGLYIIVSGQVDVVKQHPDGSTRILDSYTRYGFVGELGLLDDSPRTASVIAKEDTTCYVLLKLDFLDELESEAGMAVEILKEMASASAVSSAHFK